MENYALEVCVESVEGARAAQSGGATRLELCADLLLGGTTPTLGLLKAVKDCVNIPVNVMLRPRFGDFCYSQDELNVMQTDAAALLAAGADALVSGVLTPDGLLNAEVLGEFIAICGNKPFTLHRAFDMCRSLPQALETAQALGVTTILTSGGENQCMDGAEMLAELVKRADKTDILVGSGVSAALLPELLRKTGAHNYHLSAKKERLGQMKWRNERVFMGLPLVSEYAVFETDSVEIRAAKQILESF